MFCLDHFSFFRKTFSMKKDAQQRDASFQVGPHLEFCICLAENEKPLKRKRARRKKENGRNSGTKLVTTSSYGGWL